MNGQQTAYYAHCVALYGTEQEKRDIVTLERMNFSVLNPGAPSIADIITAAKERGDDIWEYFRQFVEQSDVFAFRALPDAAIPAGVARELAWAQEYGKPIIELPCALLRRTITLEETREYLRDVGHR